MKRKQVTVTNKAGLHARAASIFVSEAGQFESDIDVIYGDTRLNAKSIMGLMSGGIGQGTTITIEANGDEAVDTLVELVESGFEEEE